MTTTAVPAWRDRKTQLREAKARLASTLFLLTGESVVLDDHTVAQLRRRLKEAKDVYRPYEVMRYYFACMAHGYECQGHISMGTGLHGQGHSYHMTWLALEDWKRDPLLKKAEMLLGDRPLYRWSRDDGYTIPDTLMVVYEEGQHGR